MCIGLFEGTLGGGAVVKSSKSDSVTEHIGLYGGGLGDRTVVKSSSEKVGVKSDSCEVVFGISGC